MLTVNYYLLLAFLLTGMVLSVWFKKLTLPAALTGGLCGFLVFVGAGYTGVAIMTAFFIIGTLATAWKYNQKQQIKAAESDHGKRKASQVLANAGVAAIAGALSMLFDLHIHTNMWGIMIAASFSAATADTLSSELGTVYGRRFYNILSLKPDQRGLDGVVSLEGTLIGIAGSAIIAIIDAVSNGFHFQFAIIILAGTAGNVTDSILGAALERKGMLKNDAVNFLNTLVAALIAAVIYCFL